MPLTFVTSVREEAWLRRQGGTPYVYYIQFLLRLVRPGSPRQARVYPFRLDTGTEVSLIPGEWYDQHPDLFGDRSGLIRLTTAGGQGGSSGRLIRGLTAEFLRGGPQDVIPLELLVADSFTQHYGLLAWRDLLNYYDVKTVGTFQLAPDGRPIRLPELACLRR